MNRTAAVVTVSDRVSQGDAEDRSGPVIATRLRALPAEVLEVRVVADDPDQIAAAARDLTARVQLLIFTGGTGLGPRDVTPQALRPLLEYEVPGMSEAMRAAGMTDTALAMLSRQIAGVAGSCLVLALPGSTRAVEQSLDAVWSALPHALEILAGRTGHEATTS